MRYQVSLAGGPSGAQRNSLRAISPHSLKCLRTISSVSSLLPASVIRPTYNLRPQNSIFQPLSSVGHLSKAVLLTFDSVSRNYRHHPCRPDSRRVFLWRSSRARYPESDVSGEEDDGGICIRVCNQQVSERTDGWSTTRPASERKESCNYPRGQHPRAKNRQQYFVPLASARVYPASRRITHRD
jgi:hypothetical protein